ncbi:MAG: cobalamin B12-binding domain-containing protein [Clostridia bacterium]|nr:cobalamin B12-binding domain-containing protein [Clostridia bacterium]
MAGEARPIRVVVAKPGLDSHDRGAKVLARALRDAGMEVIYTGLHRTPEEIVRAAVDEDADVVCLSLLSGAHPVLVPKIVRLLREAGLTETVVMLGGTIPDDDVPAMRAAGVAAVFGPGSDLSEIVRAVREHVARARAGAAGA